MVAKQNKFKQHSVGAGGDAGRKVLNGNKKSTPQSAKKQNKSPLSAKSNGSASKKGKRLVLTKSKREDLENMEESDFDLDVGSDAEMDVELPTGKKSKNSVNTKVFDLKVKDSFKKGKKGVVQRKGKAEESSDDDDEEEEVVVPKKKTAKELRQEKKVITKPESIKPESRKKEVKKSDPKKEKPEQKEVSNEKKTKKDLKKRPAVDAVDQEVKKARLADSTVASEEERRRADRDSKTLIVILEGKQRKVSNSQLKALHPDIVHLVKINKVAFLHFPSESVADKAYNVIGKARLADRAVTVDFCGKKSKRPHKKTGVHEENGFINPLQLIISALPAAVTVEKLELIFPKVKNVVISHDKLVAFLTFEDEEECREAFEKGKNLKISGTPVLVQYKKIVVKGTVQQLKHNVLEEKTSDKKTKESQKKEKNVVKPQVNEDDSDVDADDEEEAEDFDAEDMEFEDESESDDE